MSELLEQFRLLDVPADVSLSHLKQAYKDLVVVWHPDRFTGHPRLQKKAEEKLKCINLAYQQLRERYRSGEVSCESPSRKSTPASETHDSRGAQTYRQGNQAQTHRSDSRQRTQARTHQHTSKSAHRSPHSESQRSGSQGQYRAPQPCTSDISFAQARFLMRQFHFTCTRRSSDGQAFYKSGPFRLELNPRDEIVVLANLCDAMNGFHPILLTIPCKASATFRGQQAHELIQLFQHFHPQSGK